MSESNYLLIDWCRGWFNTLAFKFEEIHGLMEYEQDDPDEFLALVDDLEKIIIDIKERLEKYSLKIVTTEDKHIHK
jgi:hypothetical protein